MKRVLIIKRRNIFTFLILFLLINKISFSQENPQTPILDSVSILLGEQKVIIGWHNPNNDSQGYIVKRKINNFAGVVSGSFQTVGTLENAATIFFIDNSTTYGQAKPKLQPETYRLISFRKENNQIYYSLMTESHRTIWLTKPKFELCSNSIILRWTQYIGWKNELKEYQIYTKNSAENSYRFLQNVSSQDTVFEHKNINPNLYYTYFIRAVNKDGKKTSSSNTDSILTYTTLPPKYINADYATTEENGNIKLSFSLEKSEDEVIYKILRSSSLEGSYEAINTEKNIESPYIFYDENTEGNPYYYKLAAFDICDNNIKESNIANNIVLKIDNKAGDIENNYLSWNSYSDWLGGVENYRLYLVNSNGGTSLISEFDNSTTKFTHTVDNNQVGERLCYFIDATERDENLHQIIGKSRSNIACSDIEVKIKIPNVFNPYSTIEINREFKPQIDYTESFYMCVFNRWGEKLFETQNISKGWNGKLSNGNYASTGVYMYLIKVKTNQNREFQKAGTFTLIFN